MTVRIALLRSWMPLCLSVCTASVALAQHVAAQTPDDGEDRGPATNQQSSAASPVTDGAALKLPPAASSDPLLDPQERQASRISGDTLPRGQTVLLRKRPDYEPRGVNLGSFTFLPEASVTTGFDSNVYSQPDGDSDVYAQLHGAARLRSNWSRHSLTLQGLVDQTLYAKYSSEDGTTYRTRAAGRLDIHNGQTISADVQHQRSIVSRGAVGEIITTREPVEYDVTSARLGVLGKWGRYSAELTGGVSRYDYKDAESPSGTLVDEQFRDHRRYQLGLDLGYAMVPGRSIFLAVAGDWRRYRVNATPVRDSNTYEIVAGIRSEITPLIRGQLGLGYIHADFRDSKSRGAVAIDTRLDYLVTELTTISLTGRRSIENVSTVTSPASLNTRAALGVDHELLRNLILSASAGYEHADYIDSPSSANLKTLDFQAQWLINRRLRAEANLGARDRDSKGFGIDRGYKEFVTSFGLTFRL